MSKPVNIYLPNFSVGISDGTQRRLLRLRYWEKKVSNHKRPSPQTIYSTDYYLLFTQSESQITTYGHRNQRKKRHTKCLSQDPWYKVSPIRTAKMHMP